MKILVTGASGFIGRFIVEEAMKRGLEVWAGVRGSSSRSFPDNSRMRFIELPFEDRPRLREVMKEHVEQHGKWDYIVHNAGVTKCINVDEFDRVNFMNTESFVETLIEIDAAPTKFVLMSSLSARPEPDTEYGKSKRKAERLLEETVNFPYIILRPTGVYGPRERDYLMMLKSVNAGWNFTAGFFPQRLTFIFVKDLVKAVFLALESEMVRKIYCVADGEVYSDREYAETVRRALGKKRVIRIRVPLPVLKTVCMISDFIGKMTGKPATLNRDKYRILKQRDWTCDIQPIVSDLGFRADYGLSRGMAESIEWYRENGWLKDNYTKKNR